MSKKIIRLAFLALLCLSVATLSSCKKFWEKEDDDVDFRLGNKSGSTQYARIGTSGSWTTIFNGYIHNGTSAGDSVYWRTSGGSTYYISNLDEYDYVIINTSGGYVRYSYKSQNVLDLTGEVLQAWILEE